MKLSRLTDIKAIVDMPEDAEKATATLDLWLTIVSAEIEKFLNRTILKGTTTDYYDVVSSYPSIHLLAYPVTSITTVWNSTSRAYSTSEIVDSDNYYVDTKTGMLWFDTSMSTGPGALKVTYVGGMATDTENFIATYPDIAGACAMEVAARYQNRQTLGKIAVTLSGGSVTVANRSQFLTPVASVLESEVRY